MTVQLYIPGLICRHPRCGKEIGREEYVLITDKISKGLHHFHARCAPTPQKQPDVQRHYGAQLSPVNLFSTPRDLG